MEERAHQAAPAGARHLDRGPGSPTAKRRVLVADDNVDGADTLAMLLRFSGLDVAVAYDGEQAVALAHELKPEVLVLDLGMPKLDGLAVARAVRDSPWGGGSVLIALTGWGTPRDRARTQDAGFDYHHTKPIDPDELIDLVDSAGVRRLPTSPRR